MTNSESVMTVIGRGVYPLSQATRLLCLNSHVRHVVTMAGIRRWAYGYHQRGRDYPAGIMTDRFSRETGTLSFLEMVEIMFIASSLASGCSWPKVREAAIVAARVLAHEPHPFARRQWFADPAGIYLKLASESGENGVFMQMVGHAQIAMEKILKVYLKQIRFDELTGIADAWFPLGPETPVVIDPQYSFGLPTVSSGVRTDILAGHHRAGDSIEEIAGWYEVPEHEIEAAIKFEEQLLPAA